jgi:hypothetical protein
LPLKNDVKTGKSQDSTSIKVEKNIKTVAPKKEIDSSLVLKKQKAAEERAKVLADRKKAIEDKKKLLQETKDAKRSAGVNTKKDSISNKNETKIPVEKLPKKSADTTAVSKKLKTAEERAKIIEDRKKAIEDKKKKALEEREAAKKEKEGK